MRLLISSDQFDKKGVDYIYVLYTVHMLTAWMGNNY